MLSVAATVLSAGLALTAPGPDSTCGGSASQPENIVQTAVAAGQFKTLAAALKAGDLIETLSGKGPFTVFAPTDAAFAKLPAGTVETLLKPENKARLQSILTYHVVKGRVLAAQVAGMTFAPTIEGSRATIAATDGSVWINGKAQVTKTDIVCSNGVIHVIDTVLMPPDKDIVQTAMEAGSFSMLAAALQAAGLVDALKGKGPFTVFAPTDEAFAKLPAGTIDTLLKPENKDQLVSILTYHVVSGAVFAKDVVTLSEATTVEGKPVTIKVMDGKVYINDAQVIITDILTSNGVIHVIDTVLLPPQ